MRPSFKHGSILVANPNADKSFPISRRRPSPQAVFNRPSFKLTGPTPRASKSLDEIEALLTKQQGIKVRIGDSKIGKIKVIKRDARGQPILDAAGNPITVERDFNFGLLAELVQSSNTDNITRLREINATLATGAASITETKDEIVLTLGQILSNIDNLRTITNSQFRTLATSLSKLNIPDDPSAAGVSDLVDGRFADPRSWNAGDGANSGAILLFLMSKAKDDPLLSTAKPILGLSGLPMKITSLINNMEKTSENVPEPTIDLIGMRLFRSLAQAQSTVELEPRRQEEFKSGEPPFQGLPPTSESTLFQERFETGLEDSPPFSLSPSVISPTREQLTSSSITPSGSRTASSRGTPSVSSEFDSDEPERRFDRGV